MFDAVFAGFGDAELIGVIEDAARREAVEAARQLAAIAELVHRRVDDDVETALWAFDPWDGVAAEIGSTLNIGQRAASGRMHIAAALRERLPHVAALHLKGELSARVVAAITWGTQLVLDPQALACIDSEIAAKATQWGPLSRDKLRQTINSLVHRYDPDAVRRTQDAVRGRDFALGRCDDDDDTTPVWGRLRALDAKAIFARATAMARAVCDADPRSMGERRADAIGALGHGIDYLVCACGSQTCPAKTQQSPTTSSVVIHVIAEWEAADAAQEPRAGEDTVDPARPAPPALLMGHGPLPNSQLAEAIRGGAVSKPIPRPSVEPEPRYRPSAASPVATS
ncbi:DUF222 domain-containing protein, partial [Mycobacterium sp. 1274761.0]|uniref:DUF222 domain-containing protein n=1 Tax=Mycobacterium sp. 1274761.0 TaxID=1834077 RepID=UPI0007FDC33D